MDKRISKSRNLNFRRPNRSLGLTTDELRNRKKQREVPKRPQDLRKRINGPSSTKVSDARAKLQQNRSIQQLNEKTSKSITLDARRKQQRSDIHAGNRSLSLDNGVITITSKQKLPPNRSAEISGQSLRITAKVDPKEKAKQRAKTKDRNLHLNGAGSITIKPKPNNEVTPRPSPRKKKENLGSFKFEMEEEGNDYYEFHEYKEYKRLKQARKEEQEQRALSTAWKNPVPVTDRLDGPNIEPRRTPPQTSTKVTITNLHPSVTRQDIEELFGAVGVLKSCKMLQQGTAEVVYTVKEDAITAYARYHNRNLDGQPMQCKLSSIQAPNTTPTAPSMEPYCQAAPPSPNLFHTAIPLYVPSKKTPTLPAEPSSRPVVFKVKI